MRIRKRYRNFGILNDREIIKARQGLTFSSWVENVMFNQEKSKSLMEEAKKLREKQELEPKDELEQKAVEL